MREIKFRFWSKILKHFVVPNDDIIVGTFKDKNMVALQYTGLQDKNGKEIYEGDLVQHYAFPKDDLFVVEWDQKDGQWGGYGIFREWEDSEVVGNIYENGDLLK